MRAAGGVLLGASGLTGLAFAVVSGRLLAPFVAVCIVVVMGGLVALQTRTRSAR